MNTSAPFPQPAPHSEEAVLLERLKQVCGIQGTTNNYAVAEITSAIQKCIAAAHAAGVYQSTFPALAESLVPKVVRIVKARTVAERERDNWVETCASQARDLTHYQRTLDRIGMLFGQEAFIADDGSHSDEVLRAKVPDLVYDAIQELWGYKQRELAGQSVGSMVEAPDTAGDPCAKQEAPREDPYEDLANAMAEGLRLASGAAGNGIPGVTRYDQIKL